MRIASPIVLLSLISIPCASAQEKPEDRPDRPALIRESVQALHALEEEGGLWPYEGRYRVAGEIPITYEVGGTSLVCLALLHGADPEDRKAAGAFRRGLEAVLARLDHPRMQPSTVLQYDMRVLAQAYALLLLCHVQAEQAEGDEKKRIARWIPRLARALVAEQMKDGGWNYQGREVHASFVTASVVQALLWGREHGAQIPREVFLRARKVLASSRTPQGAFYYFGTSRSRRSPPRADRPAGSAGRSAIAETMLHLLGGGSQKRIAGAVRLFFEHWDELAKRRQKPGTHEGPFLIAPYYFYYGHRYAAQAIAFLPEAFREGMHQSLLELILRTRDEDGTWNDRVFPRARAYGTAMVILALLGEKVPPPPPLPKQR